MRLIRSFVRLAREWVLLQAAKMRRRCRNLWRVRRPPGVILDEVNG